MPEALDPEEAGLIEAMVLQNIPFADIARQTGIPRKTIEGHARRTYENLKQNRGDYRELVYGAFTDVWEAVRAQIQLAGERDWLLDFPKDQYAKLMETTAAQGFRFLAAIDFSPDEGEDAGGDDIEGTSHTIDGEFVETNPQLPPGDGIS